MVYVPKACGFVLAREAPAGWEYLLLTSRKWGEVGFPKGHVDPGETETATALRETEEETGLRDPAVVRGFRREIRYPVTRKGRAYEKTAVYFLARLPVGDVHLSKEHTEFGWHPLAEARARIAHADLWWVLREAALHLKDRGLFTLEPQEEAEADAWLRGLPEVTEGLLLHVRGAARLARGFAEALHRKGTTVDVEAAAAGTLLHDTGRAIGRHADHQAAGLAHVRGSAFAPYGFACITHFTKGARRAALEAAGVEAGTLDAFAALEDEDVFGWEERCAALADACMRGERAVAPAERFAELRERYGTVPIIDLQEERTALIRQELHEATGDDPLAAAGLA